MKRVYSKRWHNTVKDEDTDSGTKFIRCRYCGYYMDKLRSQQASAAAGRAVFFYDVEYLEPARKYNESIYNKETDPYTDYDKVRIDVETEIKDVKFNDMPGCPNCGTVYVEE